MILYILMGHFWVGKFNTFLGQVMISQSGRAIIYHLIIEMTTTFTTSNSLVVA